MTVGQLLHTTSVRRRTKVNRSLGEATINPVPHHHYHCQNPPQYHHCHHRHHKPMELNHVIVDIHKANVKGEMKVLSFLNWQFLQLFLLTLWREGGNCQSYDKSVFSGSEGMIFIIRLFMEKEGGVFF